MKFTNPDLDNGGLTANIRYDFYLERILKKTLFTKKRKKGGPVAKAVEKLIELAFKAIAPDILKNCRCMRCPFCGREFKTVAALVRHLTITSIRYRRGHREPTNPCAADFMLIAEGVLEHIKEFRKCVKRLPSYWVYIDSQGTMHRRKYIWEIYLDWLQDREPELYRLAFSKQ